MMALTQLSTIFGNKSPLAKQFIPLLYHALTPQQKEFNTWRELFLPTASKVLNTDSLAKNYALSKAESLRLIFSLQSYYALVIKLLAANRIGLPETMESLETGQHFRARGIQNFGEIDIYSWFFGKISFEDLQSAASQFDYSDAPPDALKALYHDLFPRNLRHSLGEYYTPDWLAQFVLERAGYVGQGRLLDPTCGSGTFLALAYRLLKTKGVTNPLSLLAGIDVNPLACLSAKANLLLSLESWNSPIELPIYGADVLLNPPPLGKFDFIVGNPPWINWETLPQNYRDQTRELWLKYQLFPHKGFESILGKGKKDLALVLSNAVIEQYLAPEGKLAFILTQAVLKSSGAAEGFRCFHQGLYPQHVDDFSQLRLFSGAETRPIILVLGKEKILPVPYTLWRNSKRSIPDDAPSTILSQFKRSDFVAEPIGKLSSAWLSGHPAALAGLRKLRGKSAYNAHAGVYTGGANAIYWLEILGQEQGLLWVRNILEGAKQVVPQVETLIEPDLVFPLLRGRDVSRWHAIPTAHILMVQDPKTRIGYDEAWFKQNYPRSYAYLAQFEAVLRNRATLKRYFKDDAPFYSMFDVAEYSFAPYKVVWHGFGKKQMAAAVIASIDKKAIMSNQAMHPFIGLDNEDEAHYLAACLNSIPFDYAVISHTQTGGKSFAQPAILQSLNLPKFEAQNPLHQDLAELSRLAHHAKIDDEAIAEASAKLWNLTNSELSAIRQSLADLQSI